MLENVKSQVALILVLIAASIFSLSTKWVNWGLDLSGGTELIYEVDPAKVKTFDPKTGDWNEFMKSTVSTIRARIDPDGVLDATVLRRGENGIYIALPGLSAQQAQLIEDKITRLGTLMMRMCAYDEYEDKDGKKVFDLAKEKRQLEAWIKKDDNKALLLKDPMRIDRFHLTDSDKGGPFLGVTKLQWIPHKIEARIIAGGKRSDEFDRSLSQHRDSELAKFVVLVFDPTELSEKVTEDKPFLLEYVPVNFDIQGFTGEDLIADRVRPSYDQDGKPVVLYQVKPEVAGDYARISEDNIGKQSSIVLDGYLKSAPTYIDRIRDRGQISGFTEPEALALSEVLKRGSLQVKPERQSSVTIGPTLGEDSIRRGRLSLLIGAITVLLFMLYYYRIAGIVATVGIALNVGFVFGAISFIGATLTLPGLGGLVLTIGMAVDANILIYERIREEIKHGKELHLAVRHGFERAMVTILDANVTTFIAGLVLYQFGVGPIRGFAVTLMIGIATSLFTAFFVSRLMFHFLLQRKMERLTMSEWFKGLRMNFLAFSKPALALSAAVILGGLMVFFSTSDNEKYGLDFTGGSDLRVVTSAPMSPAEIKGLLAADPEFTKLFKDPLINTVGLAEAGKAEKFSVKLKVNPAVAERIEAEKAAVEGEGEIYQPFYVDLVMNALRAQLVPQAFTNAIIDPDPQGRSNFAEIHAHYPKPTDIARVKEILSKGIDDSSVSVVATVMVNGKPEPSAQTGTHFRLEFDVPRKINDAKALTTYTSERLNTPELRLSNPIPDVSEIGVRMVGELRMAAIEAIFVALFCIVMYIRIRFREFKYGLAAVAALVHDVLVALGLIVLFNRYGIVSAELNLSMIAAFLTIIGYSINDTIVIFDRIRENLSNQAKTGDTSKSFADTINISINQTLARTILTSCTTLFVVGSLFVVNYGSGSELEGFAFAMIIGIFTGTYSTIFIASPVVMWLRSREKEDAGLSDDGGLGELAELEDATQPPVPATTN